MPGIMIAWGSKGSGPSGYASNRAVLLFNLLMSWVSYKVEWERKESLVGCGLRSQSVLALDRHCDRIFSMFWCLDTRGHGDSRRPVLLMSASLWTYKTTVLEGAVQCRQLTQHPQPKSVFSDCHTPVNHQPANSTWESHQCRVSSLALHCSQQPAWVPCLTCSFLQTTTRLVPTPVHLHPHSVLCFLLSGDCEHVFFLHDSPLHVYMPF